MDLAFAVAARSIVAALVLASAGSAQSPATSDPLPPLAPEITRAEIEAHVKFLASDELRGRETGSPEELRAARYLARVLESYGVAPAGDDGFLQRVSLERVRRAGPATLAWTAKDGTSASAQDEIDFDWPETASRTTGALRVVTIEKLEDWPAKADAQVALFVRVPPADRRRAMRERSELATSGWGLLVEPGKAKEGARRDRPARTGPLQRAGRERSDRWLSAHGALLARLERGEIATLQLTTHVERESIDAWNVVGIVRGKGTEAEPALASEAVVVSAHYDHLGVRTKKSGETESADVIFNGADDDASGCAAVLEVAGALAKKPIARTLVFLLDTGEEHGLLGIGEYLDRPVVALEKTVADLNFEMIGRPDPKVGGAGKLWLTGDELSNLGAALRAEKLDVVPDPYPDQSFFSRSDNIAFVQRGIVGQTFSSYAHGVHADYHEVSDSWDKLDYEHMEGAVRCGARAVELVASGAIDPAWLPGKEPRRGSRGSR